MDSGSLLELVKSRRSFRRFKSDPIPDETVKMVLEITRHAPSAGNTQPWEFVVVRNATIKKKISLILSERQRERRKKDKAFHFAASVQPHLFKAPVLVVVCFDPRLMETVSVTARQTGMAERGFRQSMAICIYAMQLAAASMGLATAWGSVLDVSEETEIKKLLGIPEGYKIDHIIPLGYADEETEKRTKTLRIVRQRARSRRPLEEMVHDEHYDMGKYRSDEQVREFIWSHTVVRIPQS